MCSPTPDEARDSYDVFQTLSIENAEDNREDFPDAIVHVIIRDVDIPCTILNGELYPTCTLQVVVDAVTAEIFESLRNLETGISEARGSALALAHMQRSLFGAPVVIPIVVRGSGQ